MKSRIKKGLITYTLLSIALYNVSCQCLKHRKNSYAEGKYQMICLTTIDDNVPHWTFSRDNYSKDTKIIDDESLEVIIRKKTLLDINSIRMCSLWILLLCIFLIWTICMVLSMSFCGIYWNMVELKFYFRRDALIPLDIVFTLF